MASREARAGAPEAAQSTVLVVDDEPDVASVTATFLERHLDDVAIDVESSGEDAVGRFDADVDCVVSDYEMPIVDGLELLRRIRQRDPDLPFILFTARGSEEIASEAISAGVTDYLQKGVGTDQYQVLANRIENAMARRRSEAAAAETETRYQRLLQSSPHAVAVHDGESILFANDRCREIVGAESIDAVLAAEPLDIIHPDDRERIARRMARVVDGDPAAEWVGWRLHGFDGETRYIESRAAPVSFDGRDASQVVFRDVTERRRHERRIRAIHDATRRLVSAEEPADVGRITIDIVGEIFEEPVAVLWAFDAAAGELVPIESTQRAREFAREAGVEPDAAALPSWSVEMTVFQAGDGRVVEDYADRDDVLTDNLATVLMHPLDRHGLLTVGTADPARGFAESERDLVGILGRSVAAAMDRVGGGTGND